MALLEGIGLLGKSGSYGAHTSPMPGMSGLAHGADYAIGARYDAARINQNVIFGWQGLPNNYIIKGYPHIFHGNAYWSDPPVPITPKRLSQITLLVANLRYQKVGSAVSGLLEYWATTTAHQYGDLTDRVAEIGVLPCPDSEAIDYMQSVTSVGTYTAPSGASWLVRRDASGGGGQIPYTMARPNGEDFQGAFDMRDWNAWLQAQGILTGQEYYNGISFGVEPRRTSGAAMLSLEVSYA